jgi:hypothetical protein
MNGGLEKEEGPGSVKSTTPVELTRMLNAWSGGDTSALERESGRRTNDET